MYIIANGEHSFSQFSHCNSSLYRSEECIVDTLQEKVQDCISPVYEECRKSRIPYTCPHLLLQKFLVLLKTPVSVVIQNYGHKMSLITFVSGGDKGQETGLECMESYLLDTPW